MTKAISAKASFDPEVVEALFGTKEKARDTLRAIIKSEESGTDTITVHGKTLTNKKPA